MRPSRLPPVVRCAAVAAAGLALVLTVGCGPSAAPSGTADDKEGPGKLVFGPAPRRPAPPPDPAVAAAVAAERKRDEQAYQEALERGRAAAAADPVPYDPAKAAAVRAAAARWQEAASVGVFDTTPGAKAPWADKARAALLAAARELAAGDLTGVVDKALRQAGEKALKAAAAAGCTDPLVGYWVAAMAPYSEHEAPQKAEAYEAVVAALWESPYPPARKLVAAHNWMAWLSRLPADHPCRAGRAAWEKRYWEAFEAVAGSGDPVAEARLLDHIPHRIKLGTRGPADRNNPWVPGPVDLAAADRNLREVEEHLAAAPQYVRQAARGAWLVESAWLARGSGSAGSLTEDGWREFGERLEKAEEALAAAHAAAPDRPEAPTQMVQVCTGRGHDRAEMDRWFARAMAANPSNRSACRAKLNYLLPRWHGRPGEEQAFGWALALHPDPAGRLTAVPFDATLGLVPVLGPEYYSNPITTKAHYADPDNWALMRTAADRLLDAFPGERGCRTAYARMAYLGGRLLIADHHLTELNDDYDKTWFPDPVERDKFVQAARKAAGR